MDRPLSGSTERRAAGILVRRGSSESKRGLSLAIGLLSAFFLGGVWVHFYPYSNVVDSELFRLIYLLPLWEWFRSFAEVGSVEVVGPVTALACLGLLLSDWRRGAAYAIGALSTLVIAQWCAKPLVGRHLGSALSYPSGHVTGLSLLIVTALVCVPRRWRASVASVGALIDLVACIAVVRIGWHYPTDALGAVALTAGMGLLANVWLVRYLPGKRRGDARAPVAR